MTPSKPLFVSLVAALMFQGCVQTLAIRSMTGVMDHGLEAFNEESDLELARAALGSNLKLIEALEKGDPGNERLLLFAAQGYNAYALSFVEDDSVERARTLFLRGRDFALRALSERSGFGDPLEMDQEMFTRSLQQLSKDDVPLLFWAAFGWGSYINVTRTNMTALADIPKVNAMMEFVLRHNPGFYHGGADLYFGSMYGSLPPVLGGRPEQSRMHFERGIAASGGRFLLAYVYYAKTYAVQTQDQNLFDSLLNKVEEVSLDQYPEIRLANAVAKEKARRLAARREDLF